MAPLQLPPIFACTQQLDARLRGHTATQRSEKGSEPRLLDNFTRVLGKGSQKLILRRGPAMCTVNLGWLRRVSSERVLGDRGFPERLPSTSMGSNSLAFYLLSKRPLPRHTPSEKSLFLEKLMVSSGLSDPEGRKTRGQKNEP